MKTDLLYLYNAVKENTSFQEFMEATPYDELFEIDLLHDTFKTVYHMEGKYLLPVSEGSFRKFILYIAEKAVHPEDREKFLRFYDLPAVTEMLTASPTNRTVRLEFRIKMLGETWRWVEQIIAGGSVHGLPDGVILCYIVDIQNFKNRQSGLTRVESFRGESRDPLTGLLKEKHFYAAAERIRTDPKERWIMIAIDLENFVLFNDWYGRDAGDMVLGRIGAELAGDAVKGHGIAGYMGNDDFCLYIPAGEINTDELYRNIHEIIIHYGLSVGFLPAIGVAEADEKLSVMDLYDRASIASHAAKHNYSTRISYFTADMYRQTEEEYKLLSDFREALKNDAICFFLQPQCRTSTGRIVGAESLARWRKEDGSYLPPVRFIPVLEKYGFITDLDQYLWEAVCKWQKRRMDEGRILIPISVNVSQVDIFTIDVPAFFRRMIETYELPPSAVKIEITESACAEDSEDVCHAVARLREMGFRVLMDDFGSGYSSLNMLNELSVDTVKIDARFLRLDEGNAKKGVRILESVLRMTKTIGVPVIVEGAETESQKEFLMHLGCRYIQGYCFYKPMPAEDFEALAAEDGMVDADGVRFKANDQFGIREFLDENIYSDSMLNSILGPAAIYTMHDGKVDIVRFNEQFYEAVDLRHFEERLHDISRFMPARDEARLLGMLKKAAEDRLNGAGGILTFYHVGGGVSRFLEHFFYLDEGPDGQRFYGSCRNITELTNLKKHYELLAPFSSALVIFLLVRDGQYSYEVAAQGLERELGLTAAQVEEEIRGKVLYNRIPDPKERETFLGKIRGALDSERSFASYIHLRGAHDKVQQYLFSCEYIFDLSSDVRCVLSLEKASQSCPL